MPAASDDQIPKPLTYTLMYHFLWCVLFLLSAATLAGVFLASGWGPAMVVGPPLALVALGLIAGVGFLAAYVVRVQILLGHLTKEDGFRWSARSSWAVLALAPVLFVTWTLARQVWGSAWPEPVKMTVSVVQVEVVVWWLSHLLSVRGLSRGRKRYFPASAAA